jgi:hypothetical protein
MMVMTTRGQKFVSFVLRGHALPDQYVHESRTRLVLLDAGDSHWRAFYKERRLWNKPLSDWDYDYLRPLGVVFSDECAAMRWASGGKA